MKNITKSAVILSALGLLFYSCAEAPITLEAKGLLPEIIRIPIGATQANPLEILKNENGKQSAVAYQQDGENILWKLDPSESGAVSIKLGNGDTENTASDLEMKKEDGHLSILYRGKKLMDYQYEVTEAPEGVDPAYRRSGYIHPLNTPSEQRLTRIQPKDHYHHYGIWNPWTHTLVEGDTIDFWNLVKKEGTVRFAKFLDQKTGPIFSEYSALQEHVVLKNGAEKVVLNEVQTVRVTPLDASHYLLDFVIDYECATEQPFKIIKYRYGGFGWRTTEFWDNKNSRVLSSEGMTHKNADGTTARWCIVDGALPEGKGGAVMMSHPDNYNHPEPLRIWPEDQYGRGDLFANMATTKTTDWLLEPGKKYTLRYRMLVYDGEMSPEVADWAWGAFAQPRVLRLEK
ncbi:PmoA family protein [Flavobacteriaceae bacterium]|nr:PmoA family protein [Flavobacteriaceae bacterium]